MKLLQQDNIGSHYRSAIYQLMDYSLLSHKVIETPNK